ncbi:MAG: RsmE family RNA methyltransferase [Candidatus Binataceae bacterium]|jgi:16S rRNA (uracil1498-N3)-methyltransferase
MDGAADGAMSGPPRFMITPEAIDGDRARITGKELHHLRGVMRLAPGAEIVLMAADGTAYSARLDRFDGGAAIATIINAVTRGRPRARIILAAAIIKGPRMDIMVEKAVELGATDLWPLITARGVVRSSSADRLERWGRLAGAAIKQSRTAVPMVIAPPLTVAAMAAIVPIETVAILCAQDGEPLARILRERQPRSMVIACGPEGDFDDGERACMAAAGFAAASLGPNRLRSETAAIAALSIAAGALDESER